MLGAPLEKVLFALEIDDGWPPVASEGVWCERADKNYRLVNAPFFINGLAYGDVFKAELDPVNEHVFEFEVVEESGHSLVWMLNNSDLDVTSLKSQFLDLGCSLEGFEQFSLFSIDVPPSVNRVAINELVDWAEGAGIDLAFPVWRHDVERI